MNRRTLLFAALTFTSLLHVRAQDAPTPPAPDTPAVATATSPDYPQVTCTSTDALANADTLQLATDTRDQLASLLQLGPTWRFAVHIHILTPDDPLTAKIDREAFAFFAQGSTMKIEAVLPSTDPNAREYIQRQFVTALLWEKFFAHTTTFDKQTRLDVIPLWLVEGLREWINEDPDHNREGIVRRAVKSQSAPTLTEVTGWHDLSDDRLLGIWQRAFCYYLVDSLTQPGPKRDDFQQWLSGISGPNASTAQLHFPTETDWQRELGNASARGHDVVYTWAETLAQITDSESISYVSPKDGKVQTCALDAVATLPRSKMVLEALEEKVYFLTELELRAHPSWNPILELYRNALTAVVKNNNPEEAQKLLQEAQQMRQAEVENHQKLLDYINWFEVTKDYSDNTTHFGNYFSTAKEMEQVQADPAHPNRIRASLLQIESEL